MDIAVFQNAAALIKQFRGDESAGGETERLHNKGVFVKFQSVIQFLPGNAKFTDPYFPGCLYFCVHNFILNDLIFFLLYVNYTMQQRICQGILYNCVLFFVIHHQHIRTAFSLPGKDKLHFSMKNREYFPLYLTKLNLRYILKTILYLKQKEKK